MFIYHILSLIFILLNLLSYIIIFLSCLITVDEFWKLCNIEYFRPSYWLRLIIFSYPYVNDKLITYNLCKRYG